MKKDQMRFYTHGTAALDFNEISPYEDSVMMAPQPSPNIVMFPAYQEEGHIQIESMASYIKINMRSFWQIVRDVFGPQKATTHSRDYSSVYENIELKVFDKALVAVSVLIIAFAVIF